jgi:DNA-binding NarL/FixJ family response regulator
LKMLKEAFLLLRCSIKGQTRSLQARLFAFFGLFAILFAGIAFLGMGLMGIFDAATQRHRAWLDIEMEHLKNSVYADYSKLSLRGVAFANALSADIHAWSQHNGIPENEIAAHPAMIESLLMGQAGRLLATLDNNLCSGAFIILDATVNPSAKNAVHSRAGIFFKRTGINDNVLLSSSKTYCLRGPASVARANGAELHAQWRMEFNVAEMDFYQRILTATQQNSEADLSRLYYWSERFLIQGNSEHCMLLCIPLLARDGSVYGLCGMEVSAMLFKRLYSPDNTGHPRAFTAVAPIDAGRVDTGAGLVAGNSYLTSQTIAALTVTDDRRGVTSLRADDGDGYVGRLETLRLYPTGSPYEDQAWGLALLIPASDWAAAVKKDNLVFYGAVSALLAINLLAAAFIGRRYIRPVVTALALVKSDNRQSLAKTQITEIDDLLEYLAAQDEEKENLAVELERMKLHAAQRDTSAANQAYEQFLNNLKTLTPTEEMIFGLYMKKRTAQQIAEELFVTINTIKFHNRNIYAKLGVSSLKELMVYMNMMRKPDDRA